MQGGFTVGVFGAPLGTTTASDFAFSTNTLTFGGTAGETQTFGVTAVADGVVEPNESLDVTFGAVTPANLAILATNFVPANGGVSNLIIQSNDTTTLTLTASAASTAEGAAITYTVTSSNAVQGGFSVAVSATPSGTATAADITLSVATLTFAGKAGEPQTFTVSAVADGIVEPTETFSVALGTVTPAQAIPAGNFVAAGSPITGTINDADTTTLTVGDVTLAENGGSMLFTVTSSNAVQGNFSVNYATSNGTAVAGTNYTLSKGTLNFAGTAAGQAQTFTVPVNSDGVVTGDLNFLVSLSKPANALGIPVARFDVTDTATGTITNTDATTLTISSPAAVTEGSNVAFVLTLSSPLDVATTVTVSTGNLAPTTDADHAVLTNFVVVIPAGATTASVSVATIDDAIVEPTEQFTLTIVSATAPARTVTVGAPATGTATITDNDSTTLTLSASAASTAEGAAITYTVTSSNAVQGGFSVAVSATPSGTATAADITLSVATLTFAGKAGEPQTFTVSAVADGIVEPTETFSVALGTVTPAQAIPAGNFVAAGSPITGTINDADTTTLTVGDVTLAENGGSMLFTVTSSNAVQGNFSVNYATSNGTAVAGTNYTLSKGTLNFAGTAAGQAQTFTVPVNSDGVVTGDLNFLVSLSKPANALGIPVARFDVTDTATGTITNTDATTLTISSPAAVTEGSNVAFVLTLSSPLDVATTVTVSTGNLAPTTDADHAVLTNFVVVIPAGATTASVSVATIDDAIVEPTEQFTLTIVSATAPARTVTVGAPATGTATITDNDSTTLTLSASATNTAEGAAITYTVTSSNAVQGGFSVAVSATPSGTTTASDFTLSAPTLTFAGTANEQQTFTVSAVADGIVEPTETFAVALGAVTPVQAIPAGKFVAAGSPATSTINDADVAVFTVDDVTMAENNGPMTFTVTSSKQVQGNFSVDYATSNGTAVAGTNYTPSKGTLNFTGGLAAGQSKTFTVPLLDDGVVTPNLTFLVSLSKSANAAGIPLTQFDTADTATGTIGNVTTADITVSSPTATEGGNLAFVFTLSAPVDVPVTFQFDGTDLTTTAGADYTAVVAQTVTIPAGATSVTVNVATVDDRRVEGTETFTVRTSKLNNSGRPVTLNPAPGTATIRDNDTAVISFSRAADAYSENNQVSAVNALLTVTATGVGTVGLDRGVTASFTSGGTAAVGPAGTGVGVGNYLPSFPAGVTFPAGDGTLFGGTVFTAPVTLTVFENLTNSGDLTATVTLGLPTDPTGGQVTVGALNVFTLTIQNDDAFVRTFDATVPGDYRLVRNGLNVELYLGAALVAVDAYGTAAIRFNGTGGDDSLQIDYRNGNPVPAGGVTFDGKGGSDQLTVRGGDFAIIASAFATANSGAITFVGIDPALNGMVTYSNLEREIQLDPASVGEVNFVLPAAASVARLQEDAGGAGNGKAEFVSVNATFLPTRFVVPSAQLSVDRGNAADTFELTTAGSAASDVRSSVRVGTPAAPFATLGLSGPLTSSGTVDFAGKVIALVAPLVATSGVRLVAATSAAQTAAGTVTTATLQLGVGGSGDYVLNSVNNAVNLGALTTGSVSYTDANALNLSGVTIDGALDLAVGGALTQSAPAVVRGATTVTAVANPVTLADPANNFNSVRVVTAGTVTLADANAVVLAGVNASGNFALVTANGAVTQTAPVRVVGSTTLVTGTGDVTLTDAANDFATLRIVSGGADSVRDANALTVAGATAAALDLEAATDLLVTANVTATAAAVGLRAGNTLRVNAGLTVRAATTVAVVVGTAVGPGTADLRGADLVAKASTVDGGAKADLFQLTGTTTPVTVNGLTPTGTPTGDLFDFDAQGKDVAATANSFNTAGAAVRYLDIEAVRLLNAAAVTLDGTAGDDVAAIARNPGGPLTYRINGNVPVEAAGATRFRFNGLAGSDTLVVDFALGSPVPDGGVLFDGGVGDDVGLCVLGAGNAAAFTTAAGPGLAGRVTVDKSAIDFANLETTSQVDITRMGSVAVGFATAGDTLLVSNGTDATAGKVNPALIVSGPATPRVGLWSNVSVTLDTTGVDGDDSVTVASADNAHANTNLAILTGNGNDTVAVTGNVAVLGKLRVQSQFVSVAAVSVAAASGEVRVENAKTLTLSGSTVRAGTNFTQLGGPVALAGQSAVSARGGDVLFGGTIDGPGGLVANSAGLTQFAQAVGANAALATLATDAGGTTQVNGKLVRTTGVQAYGDPVTFLQSGTQFLGTAGTLSFADTLDPASPGSDVTVGGPGVDVGFTKGVGSKAALGTLTVVDTRNLTANGPIVAGALTQVAGSGTTTLNGPVTLSGDLTVLNANNVTLNGPVTAAAVRQDNGVGTTALNGPLTASDGGPVVGGVAGGAINLKTNAAVLAGVVNAPKFPVVLTLANGATQTGGQLTTKQLYLSGAGVFKLDAAGNALTEGRAELFVSVAAGSSVTVRDSSDLFIGFEDQTKAATSDPAVAVAGAGGNVTLITARNFSALDARAKADAREDGAPVPASKLRPLFAVGGGTVQVYFSVGRPASEAATLLFVAEASAKVVVLGQAGNADSKNGFDNATRDRFTVRPTLGARVTVNGNFPVVSSGKDFAPFDSLLPQFVGVGGVAATTGGPGDGEFTFGASGFQPLNYTSIETFEGKSLEAFAVQTAPRLGSGVQTAYAIRLLSSQNVAGTTVPYTTRLDGSGIIPNPFVVSPSLISPAVAYSAPRVSFADINNDGTPDLIIANGAGDAAAVTVIDGTAFNPTVVNDVTIAAGAVDLSTLSLHPENILAQFFPFEENFRGGLSVATGDFDSDGRLEIVVGAGVGGGPLVRVFKIDPKPTTVLDAAGNRQARNEVNGDGKLVAFAYQNAKVFIPDETNRSRFDFFAFESSQRGGVNVTVGDFNGDGVPDIAVGAGPGGGPRVRIIDGRYGMGLVPATGQPAQSINDFFAYDANFRGGVFVDAGRYNSDPADDLVTAPGAGGGPHVKVFLGNAKAARLDEVAAVNFLAYDFPTTGLVGGDGAMSSYMTGVGGVAFGATQDAQGQGGRRSILVTAPRGREFGVTRFDVVVKADFTDDLANLPTKTKDYQETLGGTVVGSVIVTTPNVNVAALDAPPEQIAFKTLRDGGSAAGFSIAPKAS